MIMYFLLYLQPPCKLKTSELTLSCTRNRDSKTAYIHNAVFSLLWQDISLQSPKVQSDARYGPNLEQLGLSLAPFPLCISPRGRSSRLPVNVKS